MAIQDPRTSERYMPRWEIWMPVFIHYAVSNVVNSLATLEVKTESVQGTMVSETMAAWDKLVGNVLLLESHMMTLWTQKDSEYEKARAKFHEAIRSVEKMEAIEIATEFYHEILELMSRRGGLRWKPPRSFGRRHDE